MSQPPLPPVAMATPPPPTKVLLIDDQMVVGSALGDMLGPHPDMEFHFCRQGTEAVRVANAFQPTVILLDLMMPDVEGLTLVRYFRANAETREIPLIVLSAREAPDIKAEAFALGANDYWIKLPDPLELIARIRYHSQAYLNLRERDHAIHALRQATQAADAANQAKSRFLANMSHEIRTPMNAILGFAEILHGMASEPVQKEYLSIIQTSGRALLDLINDILDFSKIEAGRLKLEYRPVDLVQICREMEYLFLPKTNEKNLRLEVEIPPDCPPRVLLDETRLRQILMNLLGNAVKFTRQGFVALRLAIGARNPAGNRLDLRFEIEDSGIGIAPDQREAIFAAFTQQAEQSHAEFGGTGLGLTITRALTAMMNGELQLESALGRGSQFRLIFREVEVPAMDASPVVEAAPGEPRFAPATLLVADDYPLNRRMIQGFLKEQPFTLIEAENGRQAVDLALRMKPDLILMDIKMPEMDGEEASRLLKSRDDTHHLPIVAITALAMKEAEQAIRAVCDDYLAKPVRKAELLAALSHFLPHAESPLESPPSHPSDETSRPADAFLDWLRREAQPQQAALDETASIPEVEAFAETLKEQAQRHHHSPFAEWADRLLFQCQRFDMPAIQTLLAEFPARIDAESMGKTGE